MENTVLESLHNDFAQVKHILQPLAQRIIGEEISEFPIFVASHEWIEMGKPLFSRDDMNLNWYFFASILEEFTKKNIIKREHVGNFKDTYGDPDERACIFMVIGEEAKFIFIPYEAESDFAKDED